MRQAILDTDTVSYYFRKNPTVVERIDVYLKSFGFVNLSVVTYYEVMNKRYQIGSLIKNARKQAGLTQEELARRSGTTKNYISRIENNKSDIEFGTLMKIIEIGLGKQLSININ